jgi:two-component system, LytTR family, response regulator
LQSFEGRLDERHFVRIHRSVIVNCRRIRELRPWYTGEYIVTLDNGKELTLSRSYRGSLNRLLTMSAAS